MLKNLIRINAVLLLSGCTGPLLVAGQIYGGADVISSATTGKSLPDTIVSEVNGEDCYIHRVFKGEDICKKEVVKKSNEEIQIDSMLQTK
jgi:hypothetical protein